MRIVITTGQFLGFQVCAVLCREGRSKPHVLQEQIRVTVLPTSCTAEGVICIIQHTILGSITALCLVIGITEKIMLPYCTNMCAEISTRDTSLKLIAVMRILVKLVDELFITNLLVQLQVDDQWSLLANVIQCSENVLVFESKGFGLSEEPCPSLPVVILGNCPRVGHSMSLFGFQFNYGQSLRLCKRWTPERQRLRSDARLH
mmetsp:Transcript_150123/g.261599  ORF Transcript_150123/g.261599 Transcript_150123/m.261599 type:complete len:203 (+) Transcript_150123:111-719(+)